MTYQEMKPLEWEESETQSKAHLGGDLWLVLEQDFDELVLECRWRWTLRVLTDPSGDCGEISSRDAAKVSAQRDVRECLEGLARKLLTR